MLYLSGCVNPNLPPEVGVMRTPEMGNVCPPGRLWAADTGAFKRPYDVDFGAYLRWLEKHTDEERSRCLFACTLDVPQNWPNTLARGVPRLRDIRAIGYPVALIVQNGATADQLPWDGCDAIFIGGSTEWKFSAEVDAIVIAANAKGTHTHMGRVNSLRRLRTAKVQGCDSADGTFVAFGPDVNIPRVQKWLSALAAQPVLRGQP